MRKKQYLLLSLVSLILLGSAPLLSAQAQTKEKTKAAPARKAKVKIFKQEGEDYYLLDTTITIGEGMSYEEAVKRLKTESISFKNLGAKAIKPVKISTNGTDITRYFPARAGDSIRTTVFRTAVSDTLFSRIKAVRVYGPRTIAVDSVKGTGARAITIYGSPDMVHRAITIDSLSNHSRIFRIDSMLQLKVDTFSLQETIRVEKDGKNGELKITRKNKEGREEVLETGEYNVIRLRNPDQKRIFILRATKSGALTETKETLKTTKKSKKEAEVAAKVDLQFYPNPTNGEVNLSFFSQKKAKAHLRVVDGQGKTVYQEDLGTVQGQFSRRMNLNQYGRGMYVIQVQVGKHTQSGKVVVQ